MDKGFREEWRGQWGREGHGCVNFLVTFGKTSLKFSVIQVMFISKEVGKKVTGLFSTKLKEVRRALLAEKTPPKQTKQNKNNSY